MENAASFKATDREFGSFFTERLFYRIPRFQRPYSWELDHVIDFWADLFTGSSNNFIGSFVFNYEYADNEGFIDIIDGQQRILTTTILAAAIRDFIRDELKSKEEAALLHRHNIVVENEDGEMRPLVQVGDSAKEFFETHIQSLTGDATDAGAKTKEELRVRSNYRYFRDRISEYANEHEDQSSKISALKDLLKRLKSSSVIHIRIASEEDAFEIFETVNARGVELSVADLLKNLIFKKITAEGLSSLDEVHDEWNEILDSLDGTGFDVPKFIRYFWLSTNAFVGSKGLFKSIKRGTTSFRKLLDDLKDNATLVATLTDPREEDLRKQYGNYAGRITRSLRGLRLMRVTQCFVFLTALFRNSKLVNPKRVMSVVQAVEAFTFSYSLITKGPGNRVERLYSKYALELERAAAEGEYDVAKVKVARALDGLIQEMSGLRPERDQFMKAFAELKYASNEKGRQVATYVLARINQHLSSKEQSPDFDMVNVEHILPQKPSTGWKVSKRAIRDHVNLVGNLTLISKGINSQIGNSTIEEKLLGLDKSELPLTKEVVKGIRESGAPYKWSKKEILARHEKLGALAYDDVWSI